MYNQIYSIVEEVFIEAVEQDKNFSFYCFNACINLPESKNIQS